MTKYLAHEKAAAFLGISLGELDNLIEEGVIQTDPISRDVKASDVVHLQVLEITEMAGETKAKVNQLMDKESLTDEMSHSKYESVAHNLDLIDEIIHSLHQKALEKPDIEIDGLECYMKAIKKMKPMFDEINQDIQDMQAFPHESDEAQGG